ncbi:MAG: chemotaxis protein CheW [Spirochaetaceae bacterium]|jgi:purine-binding chemotaxis protein CheW|nr:chemotaxis protein CheW [Spirochaetaceae bacterium]
MEENKSTEKRKYLVFSIGSEFYGTPIQRVKEIIRYEELTSVHDTQEYIRGVINLRGKIIPVMDFRMKLGLPYLEYHDKTVLVILEIDGKRGTYYMALAVDAVHEVIQMSTEAMDKIPQLGLKMKRNYLKGILRSEDRMVMVLDINRIVSSDEIIKIKEAATP